MRPGSGEVRGKTVNGRLSADVLYGVTMQEDGVSKILRLDLDNVSADLITWMACRGRHARPAT